MFDEEDNKIQQSLEDSLTKERLDDTTTESDDLAEQESLYRKSESEADNKGQTKIKGKGGGKKFGPIGFLFAILTGSTVGLSTLMTPALAINHFSTAIDNSFNTQAQTTSTRMSKLTTTKWATNRSGLTSSKNKFLQGRVNRFNKISKSYQARLEKNGFTLKFSGNSSRPTGISYGGKSFSTPAEFELANNTIPDLRRATNQSKKGIFGTMVDRWTINIKTKLKLLNTNLLAKVKNLTKRFKGKKTDTVSTEGIAKLQNDAISGMGGDKTVGLTPDPEAKGVDVDSIKETNDLGKRARKSANQSVKSKSGFAKKISKGLLTIVTGASTATSQFCSIYYNAVASGMFTKQQNQLQMIRFALTFLSVADAIKAGDATEESIAFIGNNLLSLIPGTDGVAKTAMSSVGFLWASQGKMPKNINSALLFANAAVGAVADIFALVKKHEKTVNSVCEVSTVIANPLGKLGISQNAQLIGGILISLAAGIATGGTSVVGTVLAGIAKKAALSFAISTIVGTIISNIGQSITSSYQGAITGLTVSSNTMGIDMGEALSSGTSAFHSKMNASTGAALVTVDDAITATAAQRVFIARKAADERALKSPFDASSPYTFLGSIIYRAWPYQTGSSGWLGKVKAIFGLASSFMSDILPTSQAMAYATDKAAFTSCPDADYKSIEINGKPAAFDIYCNPVHAIPINAQYTGEEARQIGLGPITTMVADSGATTPVPYIGEYFTPEMVNHFINNGPTDNSKWLTDYGINEHDNNELWTYYKNCKLRADNNVPYGSMFSADNIIGEGLYGGTKENDWGSGALSDGTECHVDGSNLIKSSMPAAPTPDTSEEKADAFMKANMNNYTEYGKKLMFMLFLLDERAQCILDGDEDCQEMWIKDFVPGSSDSDGEFQGGVRIWPLAKSTNVTRGFGVDGSEGIDIAGEVGENVLATMTGTVHDIIQEESGGGYTVIIQGGGDTRSDVFYGLGSVSVAEQDTVELGQVIGQLKAASGSPVATIKAKEDGEVTNATNQSITVRYKSASGQTTHSNLAEVSDKFIEANRDNIIAVKKDEILGYAKIAALLHFQVWINGEKVNPMNFLNTNTGGGGGWLEGWEDYDLVETPVSVATFANFLKGRNMRQDSDYCLGIASFYALALRGKVNYNISRDEMNAKGNSWSFGSAENPRCTGEAYDPDAKAITLEMIYEQVKIKKNPVIIQVSTKSKCRPDGRCNRHYVTVVGMKKGISSAEQLSDHDLLYIDPANGAITNNAKTGRRMVNAAETNNGKKYGYSITPPGGRSSINYSYPEGCGHGG